MVRARAWLGCLLVWTSCAEKRPAPVAEYVARGTGGRDGGFMLPPPGPPPDDAGEFCGRLFIPVVLDRPNLYFVIDASGSMLGEMNAPNSDGVIPSRYDAARAAIRDVLEVVGHRVNYGTTLFPASDPNGTGPSCPVGEELFPTQAGDDVSFRISGRIGPVLDTLLTRLRLRAPYGLTPTAATLRDLTPKLVSLPGKTYVVLLTDGAPNCNATAPCGSDMCTINIEGGCDPSNPSLNCCDPSSGQGYLYCADADPTIAAVASLAEKNIPTFVVGMPGTIAYQNLLNDVAVAGGTSRPTRPYYYPVNGSEDLAKTLQDIGLQVAIKCEVTLASPPPDPSLVNVYFDKRVVAQDPQNGWTWGVSDGGSAANSEAGSDAAGGGSTRIDIVGEACAELKGGDVFELQVVAGCPSVVK